MFEKCELATCTPRDAKMRDDICTSQTLDEDFNEFAKQIRKEHPYYTPNTELEASFDVEAGVDRQEVDNAINQAARETVTRFDFKDTDTVVEWAGDEGIKLESVSEDRVTAALEVLRD